MGGVWSASEEASGNKQELPDLSQLGTTQPAVTEPVPEPLANEPRRATALLPELPRDINLMIYAYAKKMWQEEQKRLKLKEEERVVQAIALKDWSWDYFLKRTQEWSLADFCKLLGNEEFQEWVCTDYAKGNPLKLLDIEEAIHKVLWYYANYATGPNFSQLKQGLNRIKAKTDAHGYADNDQQALKDYFELANLLCSDSEYESVRDRVHTRSARPREWVRF